MRKLKRIVLTEEEFVEPTVDDLLAQIDSGELTPNDIQAMANNGEISEETFNEVSNVLAQAEQEQQPEEQVPEQENPKEFTPDEILAGLNDGTYTMEDVETSLQNGEISEDTYNEVMGALDQSQGNEEIPEEEMPMDGDQMEEQEPELEPQLEVNPFNMVHLFDHFMSLKKYINIYIDAFSDIDLDQITDRQYKIVSNIFVDIRDLLDKLKFYIDNELESNDYNKNLYVYLLYNKRFSENIIKLRRVLQLSKEVLVDPEKIKKLDEKKKNKK